ncbi:MAG: PQQ-binding-like beta-propeller repeat protein, partial [Pirellulaceae bacterium]
MSRLPITVLSLVFLATCSISASDWPAYRHDARRSATSVDQLEFPLRLSWQRQSTLAPRPAFDDPVKHPSGIDFTYVRDYSEPVLLDFDHTFHPIAAKGRVYFGSSADDSVRCLSLANGKEQWAFVTGGPVRFAPQVVGNRLYVASDDGFVYCLESTSGDLIWKFRAAPSARQLIGNGRMISRWPLRTGILVQDNTVYTTAGMWPAEGVFVYALDAQTGDVKWKNDTSGTLNQPTASRGAYAITGIAPTGYLLAGPESLVVPTGRSIPASYSLRDGRLLASVAPSYQNRRGGPAVCIDPHGSVIFGYPRERLTGKDYSVHYVHQLPNMTQ